MDEIKDKDTRNKQADEVGKKMYGKNWTAIIDSMTSMDPVFTQFVKEIPYGSVYPRKGLSLRDREISAISVLTLLNLKPQLKSHILAGLKVGLSREEIKELILHLAMYIGFPLALDTLKVAKEVFDHQDNNK